MKSVFICGLTRSSQKNCGLLIFLGGSPKPRQDVNQQLRYYCPSTASQAPLRSPKRVKRLLLNSVRGCLPQSLHSPQFQSLTRFTLIYPSCSVFLFGNDRANRAIWCTSNPIM